MRRTNEICLCFETAADSAPFKAICDPRFQSKLLETHQKKPLNNCINSNKIRKDDKLVLVLTENEENYIKRLNYFQ